MPEAVAGDGAGTSTGSGSGSGSADDAKAAALVGIDPASYAELARATGLPAFPAARLKATGSSAPCPRARR